MSEPDVINNIPNISTSTTTPTTPASPSKMTTMCVERADVIRMERWRTDRKERASDIFKKIIDKLEELQKNGN